MTQTEKSVLLLSGGMESLVVAASFHQTRHEERGLALFVDYGQRARDKERRAVTKIAREYGLNLEIVEMSLPFLEEHLLVDDDRSIYDVNVAEELLLGAGDVTGHIVPARNLMFVSICASYAMTVGAQKIWTGFDYTNHDGAASDKSPDFVKALSDTIATAGGNINIVTPLQGCTKGMVRNVGNAFSVDWRLSWSCYNAFALHCGICGPCIARRSALSTCRDVEYHQPEWSREQMVVS